MFHVKFLFIFGGPTPQLLFTNWGRIVRFFLDDPKKNSAQKWSTYFRVLSEINQIFKTLPICTGPSPSSSTGVPLSLRVVSFCSQGSVYSLDHLQLLPWPWSDAPRTASLDVQQLQPRFKVNFLLAGMVNNPNLGGSPKDYSLGCGDRCGALTEPLEVVLFWEAIYWVDKIGLACLLQDFYGFLKVLKRHSSYFWN